MAKLLLSWKMKNLLSLEGDTMIYVFTGLLAIIDLVLVGAIFGEVLNLILKRPVK